MYTDYFRLNEPPFSLTPDPRYLFMSERHREGLAHLFYGVQQPGGFVQLTGEVGSGKTTLCRCLVKQLPPETDVALILNPRLTALELLATVCDELGIPYPPETESIKTLIDALNKHLLQAHARNRRTVLIIDEAQNLDSDVLEQVRLLTNLETSQEKLLQIILIGQPELLSILKSKKLRQISQRITARYHLSSLTRAETFAYIQHRLLVAGRREPLFTKSAMNSVYRLSAGVPRLINIICDRALLGAYALDKRRVTSAIIRQASRETRGVIPWHGRISRSWIYTVAVLLVLAGAAVIYKVSGNPAAGKAPPEAPLVEIATPTAAAAPSKQPVAAPELATVLAASPADASLSSSFADLFTLWGLRHQLKPSEGGCKAAAAQGFECLFATGGWPKLRRYNCPAILEMVIPGDAAKRQVTLKKVNDDEATLLIGGKEHSFPISSVDRLWDGSFIIIWKPPFAQRLTIGPDYRGQEVVWLRKSLDSIEGKETTSDMSDIYDDDLGRRIVAFQRKRSLVPDGYVGSETLVRLSMELVADAPSLTDRTR